MKAFLSVFVISVAVLLQAGCGGGTNSAPPPPVQLKFTSTPPASASEGQVYTYTMTVSGAGQNAVTYRLASGPVGASISGSRLTWSPAANQARTANSFAVSAAVGTSTVSQNWSLSPAGTIAGVGVVTYVTDSGTTQRPDDATQFTIAAFAPDGRGGFSTLAGSGLPNGTYTIANVPAGHYWLQNGAHNYIWTSRSAVDTGHDTLGMPDRRYPTLSTTMDLFLTGLNPWQSGDEQQLYVLNTNSWRDFEWNLKDGTTDLFQQISWTDPLLDASHGDQMYLTQMVTTPTSAGPSVKVLAKASEPIDDITQPDGTEVEVDAELESVPLDHFIRGNVSGSAFAQMESGANPSAVPDSSYLYFDVHPGGAGYGWIGNTPDLIAFDGTDGPIRTDVDMGDIGYGNPYPESWEKFIDYIHYVRMDYTASGAQNSMTQYAYFEVQTTDLPTVSNPVTPAIGPVVSPKINNASFFNNTSGVGAMPSLSWNVPALGNATGYEVEVFRLYADGTDSFTELAGDLFTKTTSVQVPPGVMTSGKSYYFRISAVYEPGADYETAPFRHGFPRAVAQSLSGIVTP